jgi:hypothetical protein
LRESDIQPHRSLAYATYDPAIAFGGAKMPSGLTDSILVAARQAMVFY